ncbi:cellulase family glycosylhydrolase [Termitidicoccus mucosus]|uniref:Uncharacterized protein n=1 Tax=Termitidicoccus mucosus TaxID=1184151 RepID=A0A178IPM4_9BACT|nr:hypothetical protein AW736_04420 [Opitutaceae bacterium TSB47]
MHAFRRLSFLRLLLHAVLAVSCRADFIEFGFTLESPGPEPLQRDIRARVIAPDGTRALYPSFHDNDARWRVRVRPVQRGAWRLAEIVECDEAAGSLVTLKPAGPPPPAVEVASPSVMQPVRIDPANPRGFALADGQPYFPLGMNLGWADMPGHPAYADAFAAMRAAGLNWTRIWMTHWGMTNLDWLPAARGPSPTPGTIDPRVAEKWDGIIALAERHGVYFQMVLQHHGQYTTTSHPNWNENPWNAANPGGFLSTPEEFFTSPDAIRISKAKYRYIVARYGHSPAILAWEIFNETQWTDLARHGGDATLGAWHRDMAAWLRACDPYRHLVTTSHDDLRSAVYHAMDFLQPHLYAVNMLAHARRFSFAPGSPARPLFYGESGHDHMPLSDGQKAAGSGLIPPVWASLMAGGGALPAQTWYWEKIIGTPRMGEMRAVSTFVAAARLADPKRRAALRPFSPAIACEASVPRIITPGHLWAAHEATTVTLPADGRDDVTLADLPAFIVADPALIARGFNRRAEIIFDKRGTDPVRIELADLGWAGGALRVFVDGADAFDARWALRSREILAPMPHTFVVPVPEGRHVLAIEAAGTVKEANLASLQLRSIDLTGTLPALAAAGLRDERTVLLYVWHRADIFAIDEPAETSGEILLDDIPAGEWRATWWNMREGGPAVQSTFTHAAPGGTLRLKTPPIARHAALILEPVPATK